MDRRFDPSFDPHPRHLDRPTGLDAAKGLGPFEHALELGDQVGRDAGLEKDGLHRDVDGPGADVGAPVCRQADNGHVPGPDIAMQRRRQLETTHAGQRNVGDDRGRRLSQRQREGVGPVGDPHRLEAGGTQELQVPTKRVVVVFHDQHRIAIVHDLPSIAQFASSKRDASILRVETGRNGQLCRISRRICAPAFIFVG